MSKWSDITKKYGYFHYKTEISLSSTCLSKLYLSFRYFPIEIVSAFCILMIEDIRWDIGWLNDLMINNFVYLFIYQIYMYDIDIDNDDYDINDDIIHYIESEKFEAIDECIYLCIDI